MLVNMKIKIIEEKENPFFKRKDLHVEVNHESAATPSKAELMKVLATKYKVDIEQVVVDYMFTMKGMSKTKAKVKVLKEKPGVKEPEKGEKADETQTSQAE